MTVGVEQYVVGRRYLHAKSHLSVTLRYVGPLPPPPPGGTVEVGPAGPSAEPIWLGIEYDDPAHGKHSGTYQDHQVFEVRQEGAGAFVKLSVGAQPLIEGPTFVQAFEERYGPVDPAALHTYGGATTESVIKLGSSGIDVEAPGLDEVQRRIGKLERLREVGLEGRWISRLGASPEVKRMMRERLRGVRVLNISRNLLASWADLEEIVGVLPGLTTLVLNQSRLAPLLSPSHVEEAELESVLGNMRELHLGQSLVSWADVTSLSRMLPKLETLHLNGNPLQPSSTSPSLPHLSNLSIEACQLRKWEDVLVILTAIPSLRTFDVSSHPYTAIPVSSSHFDNITSLILLSSRVTRWSDIDQLRAIFPRLDSLRFSVSSEVEARTTPEHLSGHDTTDRPIIIAKIPSLNMLNGSAINKAERREAETIYLAHVDKLPEGSRSGWGRYDELHRSHRPTAVHEELPAVPIRQLGASIGSRMMTVYVHPSHDLQQRMNMSVLPSSTVTLLKKKLARRIGADVTWGVIRLWAARDTPQGLVKVAEVGDEEEVGRWFAHDEDVIAEWHAS